MYTTDQRYKGASHKSKHNPVLAIYNFPCDVIKVEKRRRRPTLKKARLQLFGPEDVPNKLEQDKLKQLCADIDFESEVQFGDSEPLSPVIQKGISLNEHNVKKGTGLNQKAIQMGTGPNNNEIQMGTVIDQNEIQMGTSFNQHDNQKSPGLHQDKIQKSGVGALHALPYDNSRAGQQSTIIGKYEENNCKIDQHLPVMAKSMPVTAQLKQTGESTGKITNVDNINSATTHSSPRKSSLNKRTTTDQKRVSFKLPDVDTSNPETTTIVVQEEHQNLQVLEQIERESNNFQNWFSSKDVVSEDDDSELCFPLTQNMDRICN